MSLKEKLDPHDFPIGADHEKLKTERGKTIGTAESEPLAENIAERLNEHAHKEDEDRWSA